MTEQKQPKDAFSPFEEQAMKQHDESNQQNEQDESGTSKAASAMAGRRALLNTSALGAAAALLGMVAACSSDDDSGTTATGGKGSGGKGGTSGKGGAGSGGKAGSTSNGGSSAAGEAGSGGAATAGAAGDAAGAGGAPAPLDNDVAPLNALLTAEYNAVAAYVAGAELIGAAPSTDPLYALRSVISNIAISIRTHHKLHAAALVDAITALGGTPVEEADVADKFKAPAALSAKPTISNVLKFAASAERGAAVAYNQVLSAMEDAQLRFLASCIEGDESQHFIVLAALVLGLASPGPSLADATAGKVVPAAFVATVDNKSGLDMAPPDYFA